MAKNIEFMGAVFPDVPSIRLPQHEGGLVSFDDTTDANATAADIAQGKTAYVNGEKVIGNASGGGSSWEFLAKKELSIAEDSTASKQIDTFNLNAVDVYRSDRIIFGVARLRNFQPSGPAVIGTDSFLLNPYEKYGKNLYLERGLLTYYIDSSGEHKVLGGWTTSSSGVYIDKISAPSNGTCEVIVKMRTIAAWGSIVGDWDLYVYSLSWPDGLEPYK